MGFTQNGMTLTITPDFGEVEVDQLLDSAKIFKQGMEVMLNTTFAEATLENLLYAIAASTNNLNAGLAPAVRLRSTRLLLRCTFRLAPTITTMVVFVTVTAHPQVRLGPERKGIEYDYR